jgi:hypothetical protein
MITVKGQARGWLRPVVALLSIAVAAPGASARSGPRPGAAGGAASPTPAECGILERVIATKLQGKRPLQLSIIDDGTIGSLTPDEIRRDAKYLGLTPSETQSLAAVTPASNDFSPRCPWEPSTVIADYGAHDRIAKRGERVSGWVKCPDPASTKGCSEEVRVPAEGYRFSRPTIADDGRLALLRYSHNCGPLCGSGWICVLRRADAAPWAVVCEMEWIS